MRYQNTISEAANIDEFINICKKIMKYYRLQTYSHRIVDVDGSETRTFIYQDKKIKVFLDYDVDAVYIESDVDLTQMLSEENNYSRIPIAA